MKWTAKDLELINSMVGPVENIPKMMGELAVQKFARVAIYCLVRTIEEYTKEYQPIEEDAK